jgi:CheY-like chemotaxis protein
LNLVINARDAMPDGGVITIEAENATLDERYVAEHPEALAGDYVSIAVRDTGIGMSAEVRARVFDPFFTTKEVGAGSGLGLSMVYGFVKQSGGQVRVDSVEGSGTEVRLLFPRTELPAGPVESVTGDTVPRGKRELVLLVEDDPAMRKVVVSFLKRQDYQVEAAADGSEALAILGTRGPFDLLLSDVVLPGDWSGPELTTEIARRQPAIKILLMSGYAADALAGDARFLGHANLLHKPFSMGQLARKIRSILDSVDPSAGGGT